MKLKILILAFILYPIFLNASVKKDWDFWMRSASEYYEKGDNQNAIKFLDSAANASDAPTDTLSMKIAAYNAFYGHNLLALKKYDLALLKYQISLNILTAKDNPDINISDIFEGIGMAYAGLKLPSQAEIYFLKNYDYSKKKFGADSPELSNAALNLGFNYFKAKMYDKAAERFKECINIRQSIFGPEDKSLLEPYAPLIDIYDSLANKKEYENCLLTTLKIKVKNYGKLAKELLPDLELLAKYYLKNALYLDLEKIYLSLVKIYEQYDETDATYSSEIYLKLGDLCAKQNINTRAQTYYNKAVEKITYFKVESKKAATIYANSAMFFANIKSYDKAIYYFNESIDLLEKKNLQSSDEYFTILNNAASLCVSIENYKKAFLYFDKAEKIIESQLNKNLKFAANLYKNIAYTYKKMNETEKFELYLKKAESVK